MSGFCCIAFIGYMITGKTLLDYTNLLFPNDYQKNEKIIYKYLKDNYGEKKHKPCLQTKKIDETINYLLGEIKHNILMSEFD